MVEFEPTFIYDSLRNASPIVFLKEIQTSVFFLKMNFFEIVGNPDIIVKFLEEVHLSKLTS